MSAAERSALKAPVPRLLRRAQRARRIQAAAASSGYAELPGGYTQSGRPAEPLTLADLMSRPAAGLPLVFEEFFDQQAPMFQPVGGMDRIAHALYERVRPAVRLNAR